MPVYEYRCRQCGYEFEEFRRTFEPYQAECPSCQSQDLERLLSSPLIRMGKTSEFTSEYTAKNAEINYYKGRKDYERAAKAAEKAGKSEWEIKDLYRKTGKKV
ncbi:MAG: zinc ribbon domain-containing protein [Dehalococcoidales bacterium]|nr:zinc ribbon domain-containing protein [Dehalococcoidales bacterium]